MAQSLNRRALIIGASALVAAGAAITVVTLTRNAPTPEAVPGFAKLGKGVDDVVLVDQSGANVTWSALKGKPRALFFGFTHCPEFCPVTIYQLTSTIERIGDTAKQIEIDFVSIDPERDTAEAMATYCQSFGPNVRGLTGAPDAIDRIAKAYDVVYRKREVEGGEYTMDHTATVFLLDAKGAVADVIAYGAAPDVVEERLRALTVAAV